MGFANEGVLDNFYLKWQKCLTLPNPLPLWATPLPIWQHPSTPLVTPSHGHGQTYPQHLVEEHFPFQQHNQLGPKNHATKNHFLLFLYPEKKIISAEQCHHIFPPFSKMKAASIIRTENHTSLFALTISSVCTAQLTNGKCTTAHLPKTKDHNHTPPLLHCSHTPAVNHTTIAHTPAVESFHIEWPQSWTRPSQIFSNSHCW